MDTQNTPLHLTLWHKEFWLLAFANLLVSVGIYMMIPETLSYMRIQGFTYAQQAIVMGVYAVGLFVAGPYVNYLVNRYRRKQVCLLALLMVAADMAAMAYLRTTPYMSNLAVMVALRLILGAAFGLAQMVLLSTLVVDAVQSFFRTEANHHVNWFSRFAVGLGPLLSMVAVSHESLEWAFTLSAVMALAACLLVALVRFSFKTPPDDMRVCSLDRFFLPRGGWLFVTLMLITSVVGMLLTIGLPVIFYGWVMCGFFIAILAERFAFANADIKSQAITGFIAILAALAIMMGRSAAVEAHSLAAALMGIGLGLLGSRFLLFFIKLSSHCQRGTSQSTFFLAWESGIGLGLAVGLYAFHGVASSVLVCAMLVIAAVCLLYIIYVHRWYMRHKNR